MIQPENTQVNTLFNRKLNTAATVVKGKCGFGAPMTRIDPNTSVWICLDWYKKNEKDC